MTRTPSSPSPSVLVAFDRGGRLAAAGTLMLSAAALALLSVWICVSGIPHVRGEELNVVYTLVKSRGNQPLYTDPAQPPFDVAQYGPLFYILCLALARVLRLTGDDAATMLMLGRLISVLCAVVGLGLVASILRSVGCQRATILSAIGFAAVAVTPWYVLARPDALMFALGMAALANAVAASRDAAKERPWLAFAAGCLGTLACFAKQSGAQFAAIVLVFLLARRAIRSAFAATLGAGLVGGLGTLLSAQLWPHFAANVITGIDNGISVANLFDKTYLRFFSNFAFLLGLCILVLSTWLREALSAIRLLFVVSVSMLFLAAVVSSPKVGSAENYFNEFIVLACAAVAYYVDPSNHAKSSHDVGLMRVHLATVTSVIAVFLVAFVPFFTTATLRSYWWRNVIQQPPFIIPADSLWQANHTSVVRREVADFLSRHVNRERGEYALCLDKTLAVTLPMRCAVPQREVAAILFRRRAIDYSRLQDDAQAGRLRFVAATRPPPDSFLGLDLTGLRLVRAVERYMIFELPNRHLTMGPARTHTSWPAIDRERSSSP